VNYDRVSLFRYMFHFVVGHNDDMLYVVVMFTNIVVNSIFVDFFKMI